MSVDVVTFGCRLNAAESEVIRREAERAGLSDTVVVNTCAVTAEAVRQARQTIRALRRDRPQAKIVVTGCAAQTEPQTFVAMADRVLGNTRETQRRGVEATRAPRFDLGDAPKAVVNDIMAIKETAAHLIEGFSGRTRAFVQVQNGCDHRCTFCIIPYGRGNSRSVPMGAVVADVRRLVANGYCEVVLTGVDITSYGADLPGAPKLGTLVKQILKHVPELKRLRLSSIDSVEADRDLIDAFAQDERLMPHLHLSLQAGDDLILKRMKRRHSRNGRDRVLRDVAPAAAGHRVRRRHHRRLSDRDRGDVPEFARSGRRVRADAPARLSVLGAGRDAGRAHAAACAYHRQGAGAALARARRDRAAAAPRCRSRRHAARVGRVARAGPYRAIHASHVAGRKPNPERSSN